MWLRPRSWIAPQWIDLYDRWNFEYRSFKGRLFAKKIYSFPGHSYLQLGCGSVHFPGFLNTDCFLNPQVDLSIDARFPLPLESDKWQGIYTHHFLEHLTQAEALNLFKEARRILSPGGIFRIVVPDAGKILDLYARHTSDADRQIFELYPPWHRNPEHKTAMEVVNHLFRDTKFNPHHFAWDFTTLELRLREAGFSRVKRMQVNQSDDPMLANKDTADWENHSLYVEAVK